MNVKFNITPTRTNSFTTTQRAKVQAGIEIFQKVISSTEFRTRVTNFGWRNESGKNFNRFFMSNGMSNQQVCDVVCDAMNWNMNSNEPTVVNVVPCSTAQEVKRWSTAMTPCVCIDTNVLNNSWYSPVHIACAIMHEWCCCNGFTCNANTNQMENWTINSVPVACAWICKDVCASVCNNMEVTNWCNMITNQNFDYCACTTTYNVWTNTTKVNSAVVKINECINMMECEMDCLNTSTNITTEMTNRITVLTNTIAAMNEMKTNLCNTSLDGCDCVAVPMNTAMAASSN